MRTLAGKRVIGVPCCLMLMAQLCPVRALNGQQTKNAPPNPSPAENLVAACRQPCLEDGTPIKLRFSQTVSSEDAHVNDRVEFEVLEEITVSDVLIIPKGGIAWGTVTEAVPKRRMARGGKLEIVMDSVRLADGEKAAIRATKAAQGGGHTGGMTAGIVATALIFWPAAPFFLFIKGKDITIPKGAEVPTFVNGNFPLDLSKFSQPASLATQTVVAPPPAAPPAAVSAPEIAITSNPAGADIELDGAFVGNTPSTVGVPPGDHLIAVKKRGYVTWERKIRVSSGKIDIVADLGAAPSAQAPETAHRTVASPTSTPQETTTAKPTGAAPAPSSSATPAQVAPSPAAAPSPAPPETAHQPTAPPPSPPHETTVAATKAAETLGTVSVKSNPAGAEVYVDDSLVGKTPVTIELKPGQHSFHLSRPGYESWVQPFTVDVGANLYIAATLKKK